MFYLWYLSFFFCRVLRRCSDFVLVSKWYIYTETLGNCFKRYYFLFALRIYGIRMGRASKHRYVFFGMLERLSVAYTSMLNLSNLYSPSPTSYKFWMTCGRIWSVWININIDLTILDFKPCFLVCFLYCACF